MSASPSESDNYGYKFWRETLRGARLVVAPMVDASELAWRLLSRKYGAELCYTPMFHSVNFVKDFKYRRDNFQSCDADRPLIVQFCANDPKVLVEAARLVQGQCDAVDLNLGCPQTIARRGHYGSFLQDEWDLVRELVDSVRREVDIPITCKVRVFPEIEKTVAYAKMLESAGCYLLTVHGRTREQKGRDTGLASWAHIKAVKQAVKIPVFANGNIQYLEDALRCMEETGVDGVMSAEGNLHNPAIFANRSPVVWEMAEEYLQLVKKHPTPISYVRGHLFKMMTHCMMLPECKEKREILASGTSLVEFEEVVAGLKDLFLPYHHKEKEFFGMNEKLPFPPWICQPYVRPPPKPVDESGGVKRITEDENGDVVKKQKRKGNKRKKPDRIAFELCDGERCGNPRGGKCDFKLCKICCRAKCSDEVLDCTSHRIWVKAFRDKELPQLESDCR
ncbi:unnamed protein product [Notodromas monacha]|uniref:tRNA-dihydrouridine(16/17) synthase [NAD(P)(+)] n=1 Tax=Notodromas monacha TaxID=399045 RepID=A0A7R9GEU4_9CRUS|nr:unnamed protein product [Notodromas monacha]CAG0918426.1 unnamed protein product [Notodromas monacha]